MATMLRALRQVKFSGEVGALRGRDVVQPPWTLWRRLAWTWDRNPAYRTGRGAKRRGRLEAQVSTWYRRMVKDMTQLVRLGHRLPWVTEHRLRTSLEHLHPGEDFGIWMGPDPLRPRTKLYLRDRDVAQARRYCAVMVDICVEIRHLLHPLRHTLPHTTTGKPLGREEKEGDAAFQAKKQAELTRYRIYLAQQTAGPAPPG